MRYYTRPGLKIKKQQEFSHGVKIQIQIMNEESQ